MWRFKKLQRTIPEVLERNVPDFAGQLHLLVHEGVLRLGPIAPAEFMDIRADCDKLKERFITAFDLDELPAQ